MQPSDGHPKQPRGHERRRSLQLLAGIATIAVAFGGCSQGAGTSPGPTGAAVGSPSGSCKVADTAAGTYASPSRAAGAEAPSLLVLADCADGSTALWRLDSAGVWISVGPVAGGRAIARDEAGITIARMDSLETRSTSEPGASKGTVALKWPASAPAAPIRAIDRSPSGATAIIVADEHGQSYSIASAEGTVGPIRGAPAVSFAQRVAWIDTDRLLTLSDGTDATSRIVVLNASTGSSETITTMIGVRWFALSQDRSTVAVALDGGMYVGQVSALLAGKQPAWLGSVGPSQTILDLALDATGTHLAVLVATTNDDGTASNTRELGYVTNTSGWSWTYDAPVPFARSLGQVWLG
jgi:hypothetical protein